MFVFSNLAISLDGKIASKSRAAHYLGTPEDRLQMQVLRRQCDAILMGASTLRAHQKPCLIRGRAQAQPANVILSSALDGISPRWPFFASKEMRKILFVSARAPKSRIRLFEKSAEIVVLKKPTSRAPIASQMVEKLGSLGMKRLLVEGGGGLMWDFVKHDLIDEYHVTLTPKLVGGVDAPTLVDGEGFEPGRILNVRLEQCRVVGDEIFLIYRKTGKRG